MRQQHIAPQRTGQEGAWIVVDLLLVVVFALLLLGGGGFVMWQRQRAVQVSEALRQLERAKLAEQQAVAMAMEAEQAQALSAAVDLEQATAQEMNADTLAEGIGKCLDKQLAAISQGNSQAAASAFEKSAEAGLSIDGQRLQGREAIRQYFDDNFDSDDSQFPGDSQWTNLEHRLLGPNLALAIATLESSAGQREVTTVLTCSADDNWLISHQAFGENRN